MKNPFSVKKHAKRGVVDISFLERQTLATEDSSTLEECKLKGTLLFSHTTVSGLMLTITYVFFMPNGPIAAKNTSATDLKH